MVKIKHKYRCFTHTVLYRNTVYLSYEFDYNGKTYGNYIGMAEDCSRLATLRELVHSKHQAIAEALNIPYDLLRHLKG